MQSMLITGGTKEERKGKALKISHEEFLTSNFDTILVEGENSIGIDQIRKLKHYLSFKPYNSPYKAAIVHPAEILTIEAQNALLKTLEEASESSILILTAPQTGMLLPTVVSRCQIIRLPSKSEIEISPKEFSQYLNILISLLSAGVGERLKIAGRLGRQREEIKIWLEMQIFFWHKVLLGKGEKFKFLTPRQMVKIIRELEKTRNLVEQNVNPRLALEVFLLDLPYVSTQSTPGVE